MDADPLLFYQLGTSILLGLLVGLQRQHAESALAGLRTFPLATLFGTLAGFLAIDFGGWVVAAGVLGLAALMGVSNFLRSKDRQTDVGITTEVALLVMYLVGAYIVIGPRPIAIAAGVAVATLLQFKVELHGFVARLGDADLRAIMIFALITFIVLPILPNETFGPFDVLNPHEIWLMVVLIVGISLAGYASYKFFGRHAGVILAGLLGGAISSTATVASYSRRSRENPESSRLAAVVIGIASSVVFVRVMIEIAVIGPTLLPIAAAPLSILGVATLIPALAAWRAATSEPAPIPDQQNPTELRSALVFAAIYAAVTFALSAARVWIGPRGLYAVAVLSGLTDMDAITLSTARLVEQGATASSQEPTKFGDDSDQSNGHAGDATNAEGARVATEYDHVPASTGWRLIALAAMSNLVFKWLMVLSLAHRRLTWHIAIAFAVPLGTGAILIFAWPT